MTTPFKHRPPAEVRWLMDMLAAKRVVWSPSHADGRPRCAMCGKVVYPTQHRAESAAERIQAREEMHAYQGRDCGLWHVGHRTGAKHKPLHRRAWDPVGEGD